MELQGLKKIKEEMSLQKYRVPDMTIKEVRLLSSLKKRLLYQKTIILSPLVLFASLK